MEYYKVKLEMVSSESNIGKKRRNIKNLLLYGSSKHVSNIIVCKFGFSFKEIITNLEIPYIEKYHTIFFYNAKYYISKKSPLFFRFKKSKIGSVFDSYKNLNEMLASSKEVEEYLEKYLNPDRIKSSSNYADLKEEYRKELLKLFEDADLEYQRFLESDSANFATLKKVKKKKRNEEKNKIKSLVKDYLKD